MSILYNEQAGTLTLHTKSSTYQMKADEIGTLLHTYYGPRTGDEDLSYAIFRLGRGFSGNPNEKGRIDRSYSLDTLPQEISCFGTGDYRITALQVENEQGDTALRLKYAGHRIEEGKYALPGLPASYTDEGGAETLVVTMQDAESGVTAELYYGVFEEADVITRALRIINNGSGKKILKKAGPLTLDFTHGNFDVIDFYGKWARERQIERHKLPHGVTSIGSVRGSSSSHYNPSLILCDRHATEESGSAYGLTFVYSGEFLLEIEKDQADQTRVLLGIHPDDFAWTLEPGRDFYTPEVLMSYSGRGIGRLSNNFHAFIRKHIVRGPHRDQRRPVLINNWEGTYFDFDGDKLVAIASEAKKMGVELFVLDDGWFGKRDDDNSGLGDWFTNEKKLGCTMKELGERVNALGMKFGLWFEPEAISVDSDLYRTHPDWAVEIPGRLPDLSRNELLVDMANPAVQDYLIERMSDILGNAPISYVKWDYNRNLCDKYSHALPRERQGEMAHRFTLGTYRVLETLLTRFPNLLIEGCSGGGGRFDTGMLYYTPQIWCSDNTDAIERLYIQYGSSFIYPVNTMGAHVSAVPNHQVGRVTPLPTRGVTAMSGTFGYELDPTKLSEDEKEEIKRQICVFKELYPVLQYGNYYRLKTPYSDSCTVWEQAAADGTKAVVNAVYHQVKANHVPTFVTLKGLKADASYRLTLIEEYMGENDPRRRFRRFLKPDPLFNGETVLRGETLMTGGIYIPMYRQDYQAYQNLVEEV